MTLRQDDDDGMHVRRRTMTNSRGRVPKPSVEATPVVSFLTASHMAVPAVDVGKNRILAQHVRQRQLFSEEF